MEKALEEEKSRVSNYLNTESEARLLQVLDKELLEKKETVSLQSLLQTCALAAAFTTVIHRQELLEKEGSGLKVLLLNNMLGDISRMFRLFSRITGKTFSHTYIHRTCMYTYLHTCICSGPPCGLSPIADIYRNHIIDLGSEKISQRLSRCGSHTYPHTTLRPYGFIHTYIHRMNNTSSSSAGAAADKESNDDPQFIKVTPTAIQIHTYIQYQITVYLIANAP